MDHQQHSDTQEPALSASLEPASNMQFNGRSILATVTSNGCTSSADFHIEYALLEEHCQISIVRDKPDYCRRAPFPQQITIDWVAPAECRQLNLVFANPPLDESQFERHTLTR